jgi:Peptidase family M1 domain
MTRFFYTFVLLFFALTISKAQSDLFVPRNIQKAIDKGSRSSNGAPGPKYWQNSAQYTLNVRIEPKKHHLYGSGTITYTNSSPDTLKSVRLKLAHDLYKQNGQRMNDLPADDIDEGVNLTQLLVNGAKVPADQQQRRNTFLDIRLAGQPLVPGGVVTLSVEWDYRLPTDEAAPRECVCDPTTFFVAYWYPQVAVYDDLRGWADLPYTGQQEFYNDFSDYDVTVTMPNGFQVWATGEWQNADQILSPEYLTRYKSAQKGDVVVNIFNESEARSKAPYQNRKIQNFRFTAQDVPDFAFASSDHYNWDARSVVVDAVTGRRTFVSAAYDSKSKDYPRVAEIAAKGIHLMSTWLPGYPFPYPSMTVFNGNDGMEYPMMCNDASVGENFVTSLTVHEVSHTYFPFMMGVNEQEYAWMDEGWAAFFDYNLADSLSGGKEGGVRGYGGVAGSEWDVPLMVRTSNLRGRTYGVSSYQRPQAAYLTLLDLLGYEKFHDCMTTYIDRWKGKHPMPLDFFNTWNAAAETNLDWFWKPWFYEFGYPDLAIKAIENQKDINTDVVIVQRKGSIPVPVHLVIEYADGEKQTIHYKADIWRRGNPEVRVMGINGRAIKSAVLGSKTIPDANPADNKK